MLLYEYIIFSEIFDPELTLEGLRQVNEKKKNQNQNQNHTYPKLNQKLNQKLSQKKTKCNRTKIKPN